MLDLDVTLKVPVRNKTGKKFDLGGNLEVEGAAKSMEGR
jgi:hypothetical protein